MRVAWFTPLSEKSAIARFSVVAASALSRLAHVDLCHFETGAIREAAMSTRRFPSAVAVDDRTLDSYDVIVYNFGNFLPFHREIYLLSRRRPGICILHDFVMHHFFAAYYLDHLQNPGAYASLIERTYGADAPPGGRVWETNEVVRFPLFEEAVRSALGVVTHSRFFKEHVEKSFAGPVTRIPLAYDVGLKGPAVSRAQIGLTPDQILIVTVGHVNPNKQIDRVIEAIGELSPLPQSLVYAVLGTSAPEYERKLRAIAKSQKLDGVVRFLGEVPDDVLRAYLSNADICINLRFPAMEGASASVIEEMLFGKPTIVTDTGFYSELPDECVIKIQPRAEGDLTLALKHLITDSRARARIGALAQTFAESEFSAERYAKELMDFAWEVQTAKPLLGLADRIGVELARMGIRRDAQIVDSIAREVRGTFVE